MERKFKLIGLFASTYISLILYPFAYLLSPILSVQQHQLVLGGITVLLIPIYITGVKHFGFRFITKTLKYSVLNGSILQRAFAGMIVFFLLGISNGLLISYTTDLSVLLFSYWNPLIETSVLILAIFGLLIQLAIIQYLKEILPSQAAIEDAFSNLEETLQQQEE